MKFRSFREFWTIFRKLVPTKIKRKLSIQFAKFTKLNSCENLKIIESPLVSLAHLLTPFLKSYMKKYGKGENILPVKFVKFTSRKIFEKFFTAITYAHENYFF